MSAYNQDGYRSALLGERQGRRRGVPSDNAEQYARGGIYSRVIDIPADLAMSRGINVTGDDDNVIGSELERLDFISNMSDALRWARLDGGSAILLMTDTGTLADPLPESFGQITELRVIEMTQLSVAPGGYYDDPGSPNYSEPEMYQVTPINRGGGALVWSFYVHESRLLPVYGDPIPARLRFSERVPWAGRSSATGPYRAIERYERSLMLTLEVLKRKQQAVHRMEGLSKMIQNGQEKLVRQRVDLVDEVRSLMNGVAVDAQDDYQVYDQTVSGIRDLIAEYQVAVSAESGIPVTSLFGRSAAGMNSTGDNDLEGLYDLCEGIQRTSANPASNRIIKAITGQRGINAPNDWQIEWPPLWTPTEDQQADTRQKNAQADKSEAEARASDVELGVVSESEMRSYLISQGKYGLEALAEDGD